MITLFRSAWAMAPNKAFMSNAAIAGRHYRPIVTHDHAGKGIGL